MATVFSGGQYIYNTSINATYKCLIMQGIIQQLCTATPNAGWTNLAMAAGQGPGNISTVTVPIASPGVVNWTSHGFLGGEKILFQADLLNAATLPTGITAGTTYYVRYVNANSFQINTAISGGTNQNFTGSTTGTIYCYSQYCLLRCVAQPTVTNPIVVKLQDNVLTCASNGSAGCITVSIQNQAGTVVGGSDRYHGAHLAVSYDTTYQIAATKYWFMCSQYREYMRSDFVLTGMLYVPSFLTGITDHGFLVSDTLESESGNGVYSFRTTHNIGGNYSGNVQIIWNASLLDQTNNTNNGQLGVPETIVMTPVNWLTPMGYRWANDDLFMSDVLLAGGLTAVNVESKIKGQFYDLVWVGDSYDMDTQDIFAGHTWLNLTMTNSFASGYTAWLRGSIWIALN